jgi:aminoglycoside 6'-N-acetyltransferase
MADAPEAFVADGYGFRPIEKADAPMLRTWLEAPHVREWWGEPDRELELIDEVFSLDWIDAFIVAHEEHPFAYIQCYDLDSVEPQPFPDQPRGARGVDQFIGPAEMVGVGHGSRFIAAFARDQLGRGAARIVTDPDPANARAIACYRKAGFRILGPRATPDGPCLLMGRDK